MGDIGGFEWLIIILVVLMFFGANKIPDLAKSIGQGIKEFRKASDSIRSEIERGKNGEYETKVVRDADSPEKPEPVSE